MMLWKCFLHGTRHAFLSFYPCQGTQVGFLLEPHHSIEINSAPQQSVCQKAGTAVRKAGAQLWSQRQFHRPQRQPPHTALHPFPGSEAADRSWQEKLQIVDPAAGRQSCLCSALIFQSQSLRGEAVWLSSFLAFPIAGHIWKEFWENTKCRRKGNT